MPKYPIQPRRYKDRLEAIENKILDALRKNVFIDQTKNPNGKYELLQWSHDEIQRLRAELKAAKEARPVLVIGPQQPASASPLGDPSRSEGPSVGCPAPHPRPSGSTPDIDVRQD